MGDGVVAAFGTAGPREGWGGGGGGMWVRRAGAPNVSLCRPPSLT